MTISQIGTPRFLLYSSGCCLTQCRKWANLLETFDGVDGETSQSYTVHTKDELDNLLQDEAFARAERIQLVEVMMEQLDAPRVLKLFRLLAEMRVKANAPIAQGTASV
jgi:pyruvate decarboxylase